MQKSNMSAFIAILVVCPRTRLRNLTSSPETADAYLIKGSGSKERINKVCEHKKSLYIFITTMSRNDVESCALVYQNSLRESVDKSSCQSFSIKNTRSDNATSNSVSNVQVIYIVCKHFTSGFGKIWLRIDIKYESAKTIKPSRMTLPIISSSVITSQAAYHKQCNAATRVGFYSCLHLSTLASVALQPIPCYKSERTLLKNCQVCYFKTQTILVIFISITTNHLTNDVFLSKVQVVLSFILQICLVQFVCLSLCARILASSFASGSHLQRHRHGTDSVKTFFEISCCLIRCALYILLNWSLKILSSRVNISNKDPDDVTVASSLLDTVCAKTSQSNYGAMKRDKKTIFLTEENLKRETDKYRWTDSTLKSKCCMQTSAQFLTGQSKHLDYSKIYPEWRTDPRSFLHWITCSRGLWTLQATFDVWPVNRFFPDLLTNPNHEDMAFLGYRLATLSALPSSVPVSRVKLADAGFYFRGQGDEVQCYRCQGRYSGWRAGDNPMGVHRRISPGCPHLAEMDRESLELGSRDFVGHSQSVPNGHVAMPNVSDHAEDGEQGPVVQEPTNSRGASVSDTRAVDAVANQSAAMPLAASSTLMFPRPSLDLGGAVYPMYQDMASRRRSYPAWDESRAPPLEQIVLSGFYYAGYADCVRCFYCGVGLKSWEVTDNVWTEHIRWRPNCGYLLAVKGENYIRQVLDHIRRESQGMFHESPPRCRERQDADSRSSIPGGHSSLERSRGQHLPAANATSANTPTHSTTATTIGGSHSPRSTNQSSTAPVSTQALETTSQPATVPSASLSIATVTTPATVPSASLSIATVTTPATGNGSGSEYAGILSTSASQLHSNGQVDSSHVAVSGGPGISVVHSDTEPEIRARERYERILRENQDMTRRLQCKICHHNNINIIFLPCGHLVTCEVCAQTTTICPVCHDTIQGTAAVQMN